MIICVICSLEKEISVTAFTKGLELCMDCYSVYRKEETKSLRRDSALTGYYKQAENREKKKYTYHNTLSTPHINGLKKFGITPEDYFKLLEKQNFKCAICGILQEDYSRRLAVDHDHETGKIRGLLCNNCNVGLGNFQDSKNNLTNAINYLDKLK